MSKFELYFTQQDLAVMLGGRSVRTIKRHIEAGHFGPDVALDGQTYLVPGSAVDYFLECRRITPLPMEELDARRKVREGWPEIHPIAARTKGELKRKMGLKQFRDAAAQGPGQEVAA